MRKGQRPLMALILCVTAGMLTSCALLGPKGPPPVPDLVSQNKGQVVVALLGMQGCPGTEQATTFLADYSRTKPAGVVVYRVDVPSQGMPLKKADNLDSNIQYRVDSRRRVADWFEFFFYPTLYIVDPCGVVRFAGGCEPEKVKMMVSEILAEKPGTPGKIYTPPLVKVGDVIPDFRLPDIQNREVSLGSVCAGKGTFLFFSATTCPFSVSALKDLERLKKKFKGGEFGFVIVGFGEKAAAIKDVYASQSPGSQVLADADKSASATHFRVPAVPFFYVLDKDRRVLGRGPFTYKSAEAVLTGMGGRGAASGCAPAGGG